jgi:hypothetical protein
MGLLSPNEHFVEQVVGEEEGNNLQLTYGLAVTERAFRRTGGG